MTPAAEAVRRPGDPGRSPGPVVAMRRIRKSFGPVEVLHGVDFQVLPGEVHVLAGENGAGKSTLIKILSGVYDDFSGEVLIGGQAQRFSHPIQAVRAGVATIHQELSLVPSMSVSDNLFLGRERRGVLGGIDFQFQESETRRFLDETGVAASPEQPVEDLPLAGQQVLEIARALNRDASVVVFDEPTSALNESEVEALFRRILELKARGCGVVYITHKMEEIYRLADRITVLRDGVLVGTASVENLSREELVRWMVGRDLETQGPAGALAEGPSALEVDDLKIPHPTLQDRWVVPGVSFRLRKGEILGLAGLQGSGKSRILHALFGAVEEATADRMALDGHPTSMGSPERAVEEGVVLLTNDRKALGLAQEQSIAHSVSLSSLTRFCGFGGWVRQREERREVARVTSEVRLSAPSLDAPVKVLSGGNQQKVYLARCLLAGPRVLLLDDPTRGIDVGARADIYKLLNEWVGAGGSILLTTSEMDELLDLSHRILVLHRGRITAEFTRQTASKDGILAAAMGAQA